MALTRLNEVFVWGDNEAGQLGLGTAAPSSAGPLSSPRRMTGLPNKPVLFLVAGEGGGEGSGVTHVVILSGVMKVSGSRMQTRS